MFDKDQVKNNLSIEQIRDICAELGGEPRLSGDTLICRTICHNPLGQGSHKLYYYDNTKLFRCYTDCPESSFDIFDLVRKVLRIRKNTDISLPQAVNFVLSFFGLTDVGTIEYKSQLEDWKIFDKHNKTKEVKDKRNIEFRYYDEKILKNYPQYRIESWEKDGINFDVMCEFNIHYCPEHHSVLIPHYDINGGLIGIRERTLVEEDEVYGKYHPATLHGTMFNHPLGLTLYGLERAKGNIKSVRKAIIAEGEKACLQYSSFFGLENDICVACCGSNIVSYQIDLLLKLGVQEIIIAMDKQFQAIGDDEWKKLTANLISLHNKYGKYTQISYLFDKEDKLGYKMSPFDKGKEIFLELFNERVIL